LPRIRSIEGRVLDALRTRDGRIVPGEFIPHLMKDIPEVREFQARQETIDRILLNVVLSGELSERSQALLKFEIGRIFGDSTSVVIQPVDAIPKLASGKRRVTIGLGA
jgi:phenylacetate-CoA ligase